jgi:chemotaxis methyl-accepting protein methylase/chemotaxis response regulator CheB
MDMELPGMNGLQAVEEIMGTWPLPVLVLLSDVSDGSHRTASALAAGAIDALAKADLDLRDPASPAAAAFRYRVKVLSRARVIHHPRARLRGGPSVPGPVRSASVIGMCASTGGPKVLAHLLDGFPADYPIPLLVVQHISAGFTDGLAQWLDQAVRVPVGIAANGAGVGAGVWIAPEGAHLTLSATGQLLLDRHTSAGRHRPSGDVLLKSIAAAAGKAGVAVVLSGMGSDGAAGAAAVHSVGGIRDAEGRDRPRGRGRAVSRRDRCLAAAAPPRAASGVSVSNSLTEIAELIRRETGMVLSATREKAVGAAVDRVAPGLDPGAFVSAAAPDQVGGRDLVDRLIDEVTNQETSFVRDRSQLDTIDWRGLLQSARAAGSATIRVWSAGCATGEEAYTLALLAAEALDSAPTMVNVLGTDISGAALAAAVVGRYRERAVRALDPVLLGRYLEWQADGTYVVGERLRGLVRFRRHNLARDPIPPVGESGFDVVACRNVFIYFDPPLVERVIELLERSLRPGGVLVLGAADALQRPIATTVARAGQAGGGALAPKRQFRRPLGRQPTSSREQRLAAALDAADRGDRDDALAHLVSLLADNPLDADANFIHGLVTLEAGDPASAAIALRRALCTDAAFALAAFTLGRAYDALDDVSAARRAYQQALRTLDPDDHRHELMLQQVDIGDIAAACRARLGGRS